MTTNIRQIESAPSSEEIIQVCELVLARAREGKILAIAFAAHEKGGETAAAFAIGAHGDASHLIAALERTKFRLLVLGHETAEETHGTGDGK